MEQIKKESVKKKSGCWMKVIIEFLSDYQSSLGDGAPVQVLLLEATKYPSSTGTSGGDGFIYVQDNGPGLTLGSLISQLYNIQNQVGSEAMAKIQDTDGTVWDIQGVSSQEGTVFIIGTDS